MTDMNGVDLQIGDVVAILCTITGFGKPDEACNLKLETVEKLTPNGETTSVGYFNARQVQLLTPVEELQSADP